MERKQDGLVLIGKGLPSLDGPVKAIRNASLQARHHFTQADQVNQLVWASEVDADIGFMARLLALCSLPRTNPGNRKEYKRVNSPYTLYPRSTRVRPCCKKAALYLGNWFNSSSKYSEARSNSPRLLYSIAIP